MSTPATVRQQTVAEKEASAIEWAEKYKPANLAEDQHNLELIGAFIRDKYLGFINSAVLNKAVEELRSQLHWLAQPEAPKVKKGDTWNRLVNLGVAPTRHQSVTDQQAESKKVEDRQAQFLTRAHLLNEQSQLLEEKSQAEYGHIVMHKLGIDHYRTGEARKTAKAKLLPRLEDFNNRARQSDNDNLVITI